ncbi:MAG: DUF1801 domain-containing protein [Patescibacteria group bacterium]
MSASNNKTVPTKVSVSAYIAAIEGPQQRKDAAVLKSLMQKVTGAKPVMWGTSIVGFGYQKLVSARGREVDWLWMGFAARKNALTLYLTCDLNLFEKELKKLGKFKRGVGCLYIKSLADIDMHALETLCRSALKASQVSKKEK